MGIEQEPSVNRSDFDKLKGRIRDLVPHIRSFTFRWSLLLCIIRHGDKTTTGKVDRVLFKKGKVKI